MSQTDINLLSPLPLSASLPSGTCVDLFSPMDLMAPMIVYTTSPFLGPSIGPLIGNYIVEYTDWRWVWYTTIIWGFVQFLLVLFLAPETFGPVLLTQRAKALRKKDHQEQGTTNDKSGSSETAHSDGQQTEWYTEHERHLETMSFATTMRQTATKVPTLLITEPMLLMLCIWSALLLGILYLLFEAYRECCCSIGFAKPQLTDFIPLVDSVAQPSSLLINTASQWVKLGFVSSALL